MKAQEKFNLKVIRDNMKYLVKHHLVRTAEGRRIISYVLKDLDYLLGKRK